MRDAIRRLRDRLLQTPDTVCLQRARLVTEAYRRHAGEPVPVKRALAFAHVLRHQDVDVQTNPFMAGNTSARPRAWMLIPECGFGVDAQVALENPHLATHLDGAIPGDLRDFWQGVSFGGHSSVGHLAVDMRRVVHQGLRSVLAEIDGEAAVGDAAQRAYRQAMRIAVEAVIDWAGRYAQAAATAAAVEPDPVLRTAHERVARACRRVPAEPARNLFEGLQAMALVHLATAIDGHGMSICNGRPDVILAPFLSGGVDLEQATNWIAAFLLVIHANSYQGRGYKSQTVTVGGCDEQGRDLCNPLTLCFLEACDRLRVGDPPLFLRWHPGLSPAVRERAAAMLAAGLSMPLLVNDPVTARGFIEAGVAPADAWEYTVIGCNELGIPACSAESAMAKAGGTLYVDQVLGLLQELPDPDAVAGMDALAAALEERLTRTARRGVTDGARWWNRMAEVIPTPFTSALMRGCVTRGQDLLVGTDYHLGGVFERGLTNGTNAMAAIEHVVFRRQALSLSGLRNALRDNLRDESVRSALRQAPKWGNDDDRADAWAERLLAMRDRAWIAAGAVSRGGGVMACHVVRSLHHLGGRNLGATPDGRLAGQPLADSIGAETGTAHRGPTAVLASVAKIDSTRHYRGGYNLNLNLAAARTTPEVVLGLVDGFFGRGGQELQVNCLDADLLRAAQERPDQHGDLVVRLAGLSARFVDMARVEQDEIIARAETVR